jgi:hypothetical protein
MDAAGMVVGDFAVPHSSDAHIGGILQLARPGANCLLATQPRLLLIRRCKVNDSNCVSLFGSAIMNPSTSSA